MEEEDQDTTWKGRKYLEHVETQKEVVHTSSPSEIDGIRKELDCFNDSEEHQIEGTFRASVVSDSGGITEFQAGNFETLWKALRSHLLSPESKWLEFTLFRPARILEGESSFRWANQSQNVSTHTLKTDGTSIFRSVSKPIKTGEPTPVFEKPSLVEWLTELKANSFVPLPFEFGDNYYSEEELRKLGIHDYKAFYKHFEETQDEERWRASITDNDDVEIWSSISDNEESLRDEILARWKPKDGKSFNFGRINRKIHPKEHPLEDFRRRILSDAIAALEVVEKCGEGSPIVDVLELGLRLSKNLEAMLSRARSPEVLKSTRVNRKRPPKGKQKHEKKTAKTHHLREEVARIVREYHAAGNLLKPSEILRRLKRTCIVTGKTTRHHKDANGHKESHLLKTVIPEIREKILGE